MRPSGRVPTVPRSACRRRGRSSARVESSLLFEPTDLRDETATSPRRNRETHLQVPQAEPASVLGRHAVACRRGRVALADRRSKQQQDGCGDCLDRVVQSELSDAVHRGRRVGEAGCPEHITEGDALEV